MEKRIRWRVWSPLLVAVMIVISACGGDAEETEETTATTAALAEPLVLQADMVWGPLNIPEDERAGAVCVNLSQFPRNSEIVWRARVIDPVSGEELGDDVLDSVEVNLGDGQTLEMRYGPHPRDNPTDFFWTTSWAIPADYPTGTLDWEVVAAGGDGSTGTFRPFDVAPSLLTITDEILETIEEEG
jgi:hypothetical protein